MKFNIIKLKSYFIIEEGIKILKVEIKYLYLAKDNDQEAIEKIIKTYQILIYKNVKQFFLKNGTYEDLIQEGRIGLFKAIKSYKIEKNIKFSTFANCCIRSQIITAIKKSNSPKELFLTSAVSYLESNEDEVVKENYILYRGISQNYNSPEQVTLNNEMWELLQIYLSQNLSKLEKSTFIYLYNGYTYQEIAEIFKVNPKVIDNTIQRIKRKIKDYLKNN